MLDEILNISPEPKKKKKAGKDDFRILSPKEHVLMRPGMYIGSTSLEKHSDTCVEGKWGELSYVAGLVKCANELIDNSVDEAIRTKFEYANKISVEVTNTTVTIEDNGRGIPQDEVQDDSGNTLFRPQAAWCLTMAGSNFSDDRETMGMNGVGSALANYFSALFVGETGNGKTLMTVNCSNNADNVSVHTKRSKWQGTKVRFIPDFSRFECSEIDENTMLVLKERLTTLAVCYPEIEFKFNGKKVDGKFKNYAKLFSEHAAIVEQEGVSFLLATNSTGWQCNSFVNGLHTKVGGTHVNTVFEKIADEIIPLVKRKYKLEINRARIKECTTMVLFMRGFTNPKFDSQTKERLTNTAGEVNAHLGNFDYQKIAKKIVGTNELIMPIIELALARKLAAEQANATKAEKAAKRARIAKHIKANGLDDPKVETTLFLTEGDSAIGYLLKVRDKDKHGGYPLRGKVLNTWNKTPDQVRANKELFEIMAITGLQIGKKPDNMTYDYIAIMTDADVDGTGSIYPLLLAFFYKHWPDLLKQGKILFVKTPQVISQGPKKDDVIWSYSDEEFRSKTFKGKWEHRYIKGLGSLRQHEYHRVMNQPVFDVVEVDDNAPALFELLFGKDSDARKEWIING